MVRDSLDAESIDLEFGQSGSFVSIAEQTEQTNLAWQPQTPSSFALQINIFPTIYIHLFTLLHGSLT